jgi:hypothetical protein
VGNYTILGSVTKVGDDAFTGCESLTGITIPEGVVSIGNGAFVDCKILTPSITFPSSVITIGDMPFVWSYGIFSVYFSGNAPNVGSGEFMQMLSPTVYCLPGTTGWSSFDLGDPYRPPIVLWNPQTQNFGVQAGQFGFTITNAGSPTVVIKACTNLVNPVWTPVATNTLTGGSSYFNDPDWTNYPARFYGFSMP